MHNVKRIDLGNIYKKNGQKNNTRSGCVCRGAVVYYDTGQMHYM